MTNRTGKKQKNDFTLVEVIVVLVVLAILAVVLIPALTGYIDRANEQTAISQCRQCVMAAQELASEKYAFGAELALTDKPEILKLADPPAGSDITALKAPGGKVAKLVFKSRTGVFVTYKDGKYTLGNAVSFGDEATIQALLSTFTNRSGLGLSNGGIMDSGATAYGASDTSKVLASLATQGIDMEELGAVSWRYDGSYLQWSTVDISGIPLTSNAAKGVPIIQYNITTKNYTVWYINLTTGTYNNISTQSYNILGGGKTGYAESTKTAENGNQTYEKAQEYYNAALAVYQSKNP